MRNRQVINFLIYPKCFSSIAIPYKGRYFIRIRLYQKKLLNDKITFAYPTFKQFSDVSNIKQINPAKINITVNDTFYDTQTFYLFYADEKVTLNTYCVFALQYDQIREFKTFLQFELIRKNDKTTVDQGCMASKKNKQKLDDQSICKQTYLINSYKQMDIFQRVYFEHQQFYCALDMYLCSISMGNYFRPNKFQLVQYSQSIKQLSKEKNIKKQKTNLSLDQLIVEINRQINEYSQLRRLIIKYQQTLKVKKSFLYESKYPPLLIKTESFIDLSYLKYSYKDYSHNGTGNKQKSILYQIYESKNLVNQNIKYLFSKLPIYIKDIAPTLFKNYINQGLTKKYDLKKKFLLKKIALNVQDLKNPQNNLNFNLLMNRSSMNLQKSRQMITSPRKSYEISHDQLIINTPRNTQSFKQNRKIQKQQFVHIRREQFLKACKIINTKDYNFPMMLLQKSIDIKQLSQQDHIKDITDKISLVVLIHGYQGSHHDLNKLKNYLQHLNPTIKVLAINSIEKNVTDSIEVLGQKIAQQIQFYVENSYQQIKKITFIGFSLGGVLARACLKHLVKHKEKMGMLITLASPHLGVSESQNTLVNLGVWYLSKIDKAKNIKQLNFNSVTQKDSYLMKLSQGDEIGWLQKIVIVSSSQDQFVPHYSARIIGNTKNQQINKMADNILSRMKRFQRIQVWFDVQKKTSFDKIIGRKSHIQFIQNFSFLQMLCKIYENQI